MIPAGLSGAAARLNGDPVPAVPEDGSRSSARPLLIAVVLIVAIAILVAAGAPTVRAQTPMAFRDIGQNITTTDGRVSGRGGWGMAESDSLNPSFENIASLTSSPYVVMLLTGYGEQVDSEGSAERRETYKAYAPNIRVALPVIKYRLALTAGIALRRAMNWETRTDSTYLVWGEEIIGQEDFRRHGNIFDVPLGLSLRLLPGLSVAGAINIVRGVSTETITNSYPVEGSILNPDYLRSTQELKDEFSGISYTVSALWSGLSFFRAGASYTPAYDIDVQRTLSIVGVSARSRDYFATSFPEEYKAGAQLKLFRRWWIGADAQFSPWSELTGDAPWIQNLEDEWTLSAGIERAQGHKRRGGSSNMPIRLGAMARQWAYSIDGNLIEERALSIGTGFAFQGGRGTLDLALTYGRVGKIEEHSVSSEYWRLTASVTGLERWW